MKDVFIKSGSFDEVQAVVKQIKKDTVKDQDLEKPVTKHILKEVWKWDECGPQTYMIFRTNALRCAVVSGVFVWFCNCVVHVVYLAP